MPINLNAILHSVEEDGLPDMTDESMAGRVAMVLDGGIVSGWPIAFDVEDPENYNVNQDGDVPWTTAEDIGGDDEEFYGVRYWIEFPVAAWDMESIKG